LRPRADDVATAVRRLLDDSTYRERAERVRDEIAAMPPVEAAVRSLEKLIERS